MNALKEFEIPIVGLKEGIHDYAFEIEKEFFESFEYSEVENGKIHAAIQLDRQERMLIFEFNLKGFIVIPCDRCAEEMEYPVDTKQRLIVKFGQEHSEQSEEIIIIPETDSHINIGSFIYEYIMLALPLKKVHPEGCDSTIMENPGQEDTTETDPRWEALKELKKNIE